MIIFNLKKELVKKGITMTELSNQTGISRTSLSQLATGKSQGIQFDTLENICIALDISPSNLFTLEIEPDDFKLDFTTFRKIDSSRYSICLIYKTIAQKKEFWSGVECNFSFDNSNLSHGELNYISSDLVDGLVKKKYGQKFKIEDLDAVSSNVRSSVIKANNKLFNSSDPEEKFRLQIIDFFNAALLTLAKNNISIPPVTTKLSHTRRYNIEQLTDSTYEILLHGSSRFSSLERKNTAFLKYTFDLITMGGIEKSITYSDMTFEVFSSASDFYDFSNFKITDID